MNSKKRIALPIVACVLLAFAIVLSIANLASQNKIARQGIYDEEVTVTTSSSIATTTTISMSSPQTSISDVSLKRQLKALPIEEIQDVHIIAEEVATTATNKVSTESETTLTSKKKSKKKKNKSTTTSKKVETSNNEWNGPVLNTFAGIVSGPSGNETYYNLDMSGVISIMQSMGYDYAYWVRDDGVKMFGDYVMVAADLSIRPRGTLVPTSLGMGIVCDTGGFVSWDNTRLDIATTW